LHDEGEKKLLLEQKKKKKKLSGGSAGEAHATTDEMTLSSG